MLYKYRKENHGETVLVDQRKYAWVSPSLGHIHKIYSVWTPISVIWVKIWFAVHSTCISVIYQFQENTVTDHFFMLRKPLLFVPGITAYFQQGKKKEWFFCVNNR